MEAMRVKNLFVVLIVLCCGCLELIAQSESKDDARDLLDKTLYNKKRGNFDGALGYGLLGFESAQSIEDDNLVFQFRKVLGDIYLAKRDYENAIFYYIGMERSGRSSGNINQMVEGANSLAVAYSEMGAYVKAANYYEQVIDLYARSKDKTGRARALEALAENYIKSNQNQKAIETYEKLRNFATAERKYSYISKAEEQLFRQSMILGNTNQAIKYGELYYNRIKDRGKNAKIAETADLLAGEYLKANDNKGALKYGLIATQKDPNRSEYLEHYALALSKNGDMGKAINTLNRAIDRNEKQRKSIALARNYNQLAQVAIDHQDYKDAISDLEKAEKIGTQKNSRETLKETYRLFAIAYGKRGATAQQAEYQSLYEAVKLQIGDSDRPKSKVSQARENKAESLEQQARANLSVMENRRLAEERERLKKEKQLRDAELVQQQAALTEAELERQRLEADRAKQLVLLAEQETQNKLKEVALDTLRTQAELNKTIEEKQRQELELLENQRELLSKQKQIEAVKAQQAKTMQYVIIIASVLILAILGIAFYRTYNNNKTISEQNQNLAEQQKTILNRNIQLKKSSEAMLAMNNKLKKAHVNLKVLLKKEQETKEELEKANMEIKKTQVHLVQAEKMSSLGLLTAGIAHEINNPINFVSSGVQSLLNNFSELKSYIENYQKVLSLDDFNEIKKYRAILQEDEDALADLQAAGEELLEDVNYGITRITEIVNGLRTFSRHDEAEVKDADMNESFASALLILKNKYKNKAEIVQEFDQDLPQIQCFPGQINQVFVNLINNALDAMDEGGTITLATKNLNDDYIEMKISDNGSGMPPEVRDKIFDPFFTTKDIGKGTGLGLSISHGIIEKHKGTIEVESEVGVGTTFIIKLPKKLEVDDKVLEEQLLN